MAKGYFSFAQIKKREIKRGFLQKLMTNNLYFLFEKLQK